jgi:hypothetical protein
VTTIRVQQRPDGLQQSHQTGSWDGGKLREVARGPRGPGWSKPMRRWPPPFTSEQYRSALCRRGASRRGARRML